MSATPFQRIDIGLDIDRIPFWPEFQFVLENIPVS